MVVLLLPRVCSGALELRRADLASDIANGDGLGGMSTLLFLILGTVLADLFTTTTPLLLLLLLVVTSFEVRFVGARSFLDDDDDWRRGGVCPRLLLLADPIRDNDGTWIFLAPVDLLLVLDFFNCCSTLFFLPLMILTSVDDGGGGGVNTTRLLLWAKGGSTLLHRISRPLGDEGGGGGIVAVGVLVADGSCTPCNSGCLRSSPSSGGSNRFILDTLETELTSVGRLRCCDESCSCRDDDCFVAWLFSNSANDTWDGRTPMGSAETALA